MRGMEFNDSSFLRLALAEMERFMWAWSRLVMGETDCGLIYIWFRLLDGFCWWLLRFSEGFGSFSRYPQFWKFRGNVTKLNEGVFF